MRQHPPLAQVEYQDISYTAWRAMWMDYIGPGNASLPEEVHRFTYERVSNSSGALKGFVAADTQPIGFVHYYFHPSSYNLTEACTIEDLYVSPESRGLGVGRWLIEQVAKIASAQAAPALHWKTSIKNTPAIALYKTLAQQVEVLTFRKQL